MRYAMLGQTGLLVSRLADYDKRHTLYSQLAVFGDPARVVLARLAAEYRGLA